MPTLLKRDSSDLLSTNALNAPDKHIKQSMPEDANLARLDALLVAWGQGKLNMPEAVQRTMEEFFTKDLIFDVGTANAHAGVPEYKEYTFETTKHWFAYVAGFDIADMSMAAVSSKDDASQIWQTVSAKTTSKATGRSLLLESLNIYTFDGDKIKRVTVIYADPSRLAYLNGTLTEAPTAVKLPAFEPNPDPKPVFEAVLAAWGAGEFATAETKQAAFDKAIRPDIVIDASSAVLPEHFKAYHGHAGTDAWANKVFGSWELTRMDITVEAGLKPGCVMQKLDCDAKREGNEAKGIVLYIESAYDVDGKAVFQKMYWENPQMAASLYAKEHTM